MIKNGGITIVLALSTGTASAAVSVSANSSNAQPLCVAHREAAHAELDVTDRRAAMAAEIEAYQLLVEEALSLRAEAIAFHRKLQAKVQRKEPLSGADLQMLNQGTFTLLAQRQQLFDVAERHECWTAHPPAKDPQQAAIDVAAVAMSLSAALVLYDNYLSAIAPYYNDHALRRHLNRSDSGFERHAGTLSAIASSFSSTENRQRMRRAINWLQKHHVQANAAPLPGYRYVQTLVEQSPALAMVRDVKPLKSLFGGLAALSSFAIDGMFSLKDEGTNFSSLLFGNTIGLVEMRRGKLYQQPQVAEHILKTLRAGDILLEKTPFRLSDTFIPGHWGHAAIWVGNETELRALGIWEHPVVQPHQQALRDGHAVVEALRSGVEMNTLSHFLNVDDLGVLRHDSISDEQRIAVILLSLRQLGKSYDFNFDAETTTRIFCSKLIYLAYGDLRWPTSRILGRVTVSPDDIASRAFGDGPLHVALLYHDGREVKEDRRSFMQKLQQPVRLLSENSARR